MNIEQMREWADSGDFLPCYLIEVQVFDGTEERTLYLSDRGFVTEASDTPSNTSYVPVVADIGTITERLSVNGSASVGHGSITLSNMGGESDHYLDYIWDNRPLKILLGDVKWPRSEFFTVFSGSTERLNARSSTSLELLVRDRLNLLNGPVSELTTANERTVPCSFGDVSNVPSLLVDPAHLTYQVHPSSVELIAEVRDNGVPVAFSGQEADGKFQLAASPIGDVTAVVLGDSSGGFSRDCAGLVRKLITNYGPETGRATIDEIDGENFSQFALDHPDCLGLFLEGRENLLSVLSQLTGSVNSSLIVGKQGKFKLVHLQAPELAPEPATVITPADMAENSFKPMSREPISAAVKLAYNRNYLPLSTPAGGLPDAHKDTLQEEWKFVKAVDEDIAAKYRLNVEPVTKESLLQVTEDAQQQVEALLELFSVQRYIYTLRCFFWVMPIGIGDLIKVHYPRFGFENGRNALVVGAKTAWSKGYVDLEIFV